MKREATLLTLVLVLPLVASCKDAPKDSSPTPAAQPASKPAAAAPAEVTLSAEQAAALRPLLQDYESMRALLANDKTEGLGTLAKGLAERCSGLSSGAPEALRPHLQKLGAQARVLETASLESIKTARLVFGELSREVVGMLAASSSLREGLRVFECGMADGYQKWVQPGEELENPYMGQAMLACGSATSWE